MRKMTSILFADLVRSDLTAVYDLRVIINNAITGYFTIDILLFSVFYRLYPHQTSCFYMYGLNVSVNNCVTDNPEW